MISENEVDDVRVCCGIVGFFIEIGADSMAR